MTKEYREQYYAKNKAKWQTTYSPNQYNKVSCSCGSLITKKHLDRHMGTKVHYKKEKLLAKEKTNNNELEELKKRVELLEKVNASLNVNEEQKCV